MKLTPNLRSTVLAVVVLLSVERSLAPNAFAQDLGAAALAAGGSATVVQVVQQAINILPPALSQATYYEYDDKVGLFVPSERMGSAVFREPRTLPKGRFTIRAAASYFELSGSVATVYKQADFDRYAAYGSRLSVQAGILSLAATYGLTDMVELELGVPITLIDASQSQLLPTNTRAFDPPINCSWPTNPCPGATVPTVDDARTLSRTGRVSVPGEGDVILDPVRTNDVAPGAFNDGTSVGLGRISLGSKIALARSESYGISVLPQVFLPSPSSDEYAGPDSAALAIGALGGYSPADWMQLILNVGYEWDTESTALTRFAWAAGASFPTEYATFDVGMSGSVYQNGVAWSPEVLPDADPGRSLFAVDEDSVRLDSTFAEFVGGFKIPLGSVLGLSGSVAVPVDGTDFRPAVLGTVALEGSF